MTVSTLACLTDTIKKFSGCLCVAFLYLPAPRLVGRKEASPTILNFVPQMLDVT